MSQSKKIFTRMCLNNWGGINHKVLQFNEYVNLFSGKSGSGKSTVMDAIQVILYGSFSPTFLNKAADDAKNRRSVLSYLRGEQKDGSANRGDCDFCSVIALEIEDTGSHTFTCIGIAFEVRKNDSEIKRFVYFSHSGRMPEPSYVTADGFCYSNNDIKKLVNTRSQSADRRARGDVNRIYASKEAYLGTLYDVILGYIDPNRFITMEKSAIALRMTNGTGQFIRDYMFPKSDSGTIETISEQLDAYRQIREKIEDMRKRIELLKEIKESGQELVNIQSDIVMAETMIRCIDIEDMRAKIQAAEDDKKRIEEEQDRLSEKADDIAGQQADVQQEYIQVCADLKSSDLGSKKDQLRELEKRSLMLTDNSRQWIKITNGLKAWDEDEVITDYVSNAVLNLIEEIVDGDVPEAKCQELHLKLESIKKDIEDELEDNTSQKNEITKELKEKKRLVDDMKNNRKSYSESLRSARAALQRDLSDRFGEPVKVQVFADMFDVQDEEWKNAIEGRMGRLKFSLITEPRYAHTAAVIFRDMKQFEDVDLINSRAIMDSEPKAMDGSLYEAVDTKEKYVDVCRLQAISHIANGACMVEYWHWHSIHNAIESYWKGVLSHDLRPNRLYKECSVIGNELKKYGHRLVNLKKTNRFAVIADNASLTGLNEFKLNNESDSNYNTVFRWICDALYLMNIEYDVIPADPALFASYENILVPALYSATDDVLNALNEFVANGGNMVVTFKSAFSDEHLKIRHEVQPYIINKALGIQYDEFTLPDDVTVTCGGKSSKARDWMEMVDCTTATPVAMYEHTHWGVHAAITENSYGKGRAMYLATLFGEDTLIEALKLFFGEAKNEFDASYPVVIKRGTNMQGEKIIYLLNYSDDEQTVTCHADGLKKLCDDSTVSAGDCIALAPWDFSILYAD